MTAKNDARLNVRLPVELKRTIEEAAAQLGQTVSDFAVSTLVHTARQVIREQRVTVLTQRDWELFTSIIDDTSAKPNEALAAAAKRYKQRVRKRQAR
ncbi:MAG TPA: DUF1778 domain-containing protein [Pirellulales bacterium]|nr:DUF1778 domain-containing protein [Pirellulales bacterium]